MSHNPGYPCAAAAGSVTFSAKTGATITPVARIEKTITSFLVATIQFRYRCRLKMRLHLVHCDVLRFGNIVVTSQPHLAHGAAPVPPNSRRETSRCPATPPGQARSGLWLQKNFGVPAATIYVE